MMLCCYDATMTTHEKRRTTIYLDPEVLEFLSLRRIRGAGSVSQQLERLARDAMPRERGADELRTLDERHRRGYEAHPVAEDEFAPLIASQVVIDDEPRRSKR
jgi:hypothetical protein